jgi:hypothetical protein
VAAPQSNENSDNYALAMLRVRGIERVRLPADLTILGSLALELAKTWAVPSAA